MGHHLRATGGVAARLIFKGCLYRSTEKSFIAVITTVFTYPVTKYKSPQLIQASKTEIYEKFNKTA